MAARESHPHWLTLIWRSTLVTHCLAFLRYGSRRADVWLFFLLFCVCVGGGGICICANLNTPVVLGLQWWQAVSLQAADASWFLLVRRHTEPRPGLMSQHLCAPTVINCLQPCRLHCSLFFFSKHFSLIDSICFHLLCIDYFVPLCLVNRRNL